MVLNALIKREYDYAIRICAFLAGSYGKGPIPISVISRRLYISKPFTTKIAYKLKSAGLITTVQGKVGGAKLARDPRTISIYDVLEAMGFDAALNECLRADHFCPLLATCKIHLFFGQQQELLMDNFKRAKISDFAFTESDLAEE